MTFWHQGFAILHLLVHSLSSAYFRVDQLFWKLVQVGFSHSISDSEIQPSIEFIFGTFGLYQSAKINPYLMRHLQSILSRSYSTMSRQSYV